MPVLMSVSNILGSKNVKNGDTVKFTTAGGWEEEKFKDQDARQVFKIGCQLNGATEEKVIKLTKASRTQLIEAWGNDTDKWVGQSAQIMLIPTEKGKSILLTAIAWKD